MDGRDQPMFQFADSQPSHFNKWYNGTLQKATPTVSYEFSYNISSTNRTAVRISTISPNSGLDYPVIVVVREEHSVMSWQVPLQLQYQYSYTDVSRTLCPVNLQGSNASQTEQTFVVSLSTQSHVNISYSLLAEMIDIFNISTNSKKVVKSSPAKPTYYMYTFPEGVESVRVIAKSADKICAILSIQDALCPVLDLDEDIRYRGLFQTMTTQGALTKDISVSDAKSFFIVLVVAPTDLGCTNDRPGTTKVGSLREKTFTIEVKETVPTSQYYKAILAAIGIFVAFYVVAMVIGIWYHGCTKDWGVIDHATFDRSMSEDPDHDPANARLIRDNNTRGGYGAITEGYQNETGATQRTTSRSTEETEEEDEDNEDRDSINSDEYDFVREAEHDKDIIRTKKKLYVSDLSKKSEKRMEKNYRLYLTNLFTISVFYGLPVLQLVMTYQKVLNTTGNQDICYYNFACAHPLGYLSAFNNIYSNIGYVMLGILFLILVKRRAFIHKMAVEKSGDRHKYMGIPQHFGLYYAMGLALCMEGFMSACYHVCPTVSNFQFDTSFMYIMACLCILKIYQNRHPDISAKSHSAYLVMAIVIILAVIGVIYGTNIFWIVFTLLYMGCSLVLSIHLYYMGRWRLDRYIPCRLWFLFRRDVIRCHKPAYLDRLILLLIGNIVNWTLALLGVMQDEHPDFATFLLGIFIGNLLLLICFYIIAKLIAREKIPTLTWVLIIMSAVIWGLALYFFLAHLTSWQLTPAESREGNKECILLDFYDAHDVWHFLSAISLFFSFLVIMTLDDELVYKRRDQILVF